MKCFSDEEVQKIIIEYIIKSLIKFKKIVSTRDVLNFIHDILVPSEISDNQTFLDNLLPNLLFNNAECSDLLRLFSYFDPTLQRSEELDQFIIDLNINNDLLKLLNEYFDLNNLGFLEEYIKDNLDLIEQDEETKIRELKKFKKNITNMLIRFTVFYGVSDVKSTFKDETYLNYLKYLYHYNMQNYPKYRDLSNQIKNAIFNWKGSDKKNYICMDYLSSFKISKKLELKPKLDKWEADVEDNSLKNRFKKEITIYYKINNPTSNFLPLNVDLSLYEYIIKLNKGFKPNKSEKDDLIIFEEYINDLIKEDTNGDLFIENLISNKQFSLEYEDDFEQFYFNEA